MNNFFLKIFMALNTFAIRLSRGRLGSRLGTQTILLLHSRGHKSGKQYVTPIAYFHTDGFYFLVGSNWGKDQNAGWYYNLLAQPRTIIEVKGRQDPGRGAPGRRSGIRPAVEICHRTPPALSALQGNDEAAYPDHGVEAGR